MSAVAKVSNKNPLSLSALWDKAVHSDTGKVLKLDKVDETIDRMIVTEEEKNAKAIKNAKRQLGALWKIAGERNVALEAIEARVTDQGLKIFEGLETLLDPSNGKNQPLPADSEGSSHETSSNVDTDESPATTHEKKQETASKSPPSERPRIKLEKQISPNWRKKRGGNLPRVEFVPFEKK